MELNKENELCPTNLISEETKLQRKICWNALFEKYEKVAVDKSGIEVNNIVKTFTRDKFKRSSLPNDSILASSKKAFYLSYSSDSSYNKRKRGRPRKIPVKYTNELSSHIFSSKVLNTINDKSYDELENKNEQLNNESIIKVNKTITESITYESLSQQKFSDKNRKHKRYWKNSFFEDLIMKPIVKRKQKKLNKKARKMIKKLENDSKEIEPLNNKTYVLSEDFRRIEPFEIPDQSIIEKSNEEVEVIEDDVSSTMPDIEDLMPHMEDSVPSKENPMLNMEDSMPYKENPMLNMEDSMPYKENPKLDMEDSVPDMEDPPEEKPPIENVVLKFVNKHKDIVTFTTKHKIERELKSELGYMAYKRYQCAKLPNKHELEFWNNAVKMEIQKLSLVISLEEIYKYMAESLRLWISLTN